MRLNQTDGSIRYDEIANSAYPLTESKSLENSAGELN